MIRNSGHGSNYKTIPAKKVIPTKTGTSSPPQTKLVYVSTNSGIFVPLGVTNVLIENIRLENNYTGIGATNCLNVTIRDVLVVESADNGLAFNYNCSGITADHVTIANGNGGVYASQSSVSIKNSIIIRNTYGLAAVASTITSDYNDVWGNLRKVKKQTIQTNYSRVTPGANDISIDPLLDQNYQITENSAVKGAGENSTDIGGYPQGIIEEEQGQEIETTRYLHQDHLGSSAIITDETGQVAGIIDYFPHGETRFEISAENEPGTNYKYTGKEQDETGLYYYGARYYDTKIGRFISVDPAVLKIGTKNKPENNKQALELLTIPQSQNSYSYALNNPLKYNDPNGNWFETVVDVISFVLSAQAFVNGPGIWNGIFLGLDTAALGTPFVPAVPGYIRNGSKVGKILKYFNEVSNSAQVAEKYTKADIVLLYLKNAFFEMDNALKWTAGKAENALGNLVGHFAKHGDEVGAKTVREYYDKANEFVFSSNYTWIDEFGDIVHFDPSNQLATISTFEGEIRTFHKVNQPEKLEKFLKKVEELDNAE